MTTTTPPAPPSRPLSPEEQTAELVRRHAMPDAAVLERIGIEQLAAALSLIPVMAFDGAFSRAGARNRDVLADFLFSQAKRFTNQNGVFASLTRDRARLAESNR